MSTDTVADRLTGKATAHLWPTLRTVLFGDRLGLSFFLASLCLFGLFWRASFFITDSYALANGLYSLSNGQVVLTDAAYGSGLETPGAHPYGGDLLSRNYGALILSLPFVFLIEAIDAVASLRIAFVALWSLALLALFVQVARYTGRPRIASGGAIVVLCLFVLNVAVARPLEAKTHLYALQLFHATVAAFAPVLLYRLLARQESTRIAVIGGVLLLVGTPLALWATVPKRHVLTATVVLGIAYALYRSREPVDGPLVSRPLTFRALAYALVGLYAWVHAPEALLLGAVLVVVDVSTATDNRLRPLLVLTVVFLLSLLPFFVTNVLVAGSPITPPRLLAGAQSAVEASSTASGTTGSSSAPAASPSGGPSALDRVTNIVSTAMLPIALLFGEFRVGVETALLNPDALYQTVVRSGYNSGTLDLANEEAVNLSLLESAPVLAGLTAVVPAIRRWRRSQSAYRIRSATGVADLFAALTVLASLLFYASRLPIHAQVTVRYIFPLFPLGIYLLVRLPAVRTTLDDHWRTFCWTVAVATLVGGQFVVVAVALWINGIGEAFQLHALLSLSTALPLALWAATGRTEGWVGRLGAVLLGLATTAALLFGVLTVLEYYPLGNSHVLPLIRTVADVLELL
ncbi:hypothetical protein [Haloarcula nitratireducens]|uniref:Glycosyltransferase RgtA/B/C/D-like domain-containing protein n=1 Tax=Haloarcula nitratireducens TaxID=2487749 RepID=A0AAW4P7D1_9EURY|nr:hypothetical protein [Halomicroarcula nitratireducens]MBX0293850.1 hypothetical protein [Halomicroarcula nitratireducens]